MKIDPLGMRLAQVGGPREATATDEKSKPDAVGGKGHIDPEKLRLAKEFEEIFIRKMLSSLEKSGHSTEKSGGSSGGDAYSSMVVSAMAQAVSQGGGVGLAEMIARSATEQAALQDAAKVGTAIGRLGIPLAVPSSPSVLPANTSAHPSPLVAPSGPTYPRPSPTQIVNENDDIRMLLKDPKP